jgi:hypothetical protein
MTYTYCCVYSVETPDDGQRTCPRHVEFYSKNKFEKLVHLVGFIIRIYHDARFSECQKHPETYLHPIPRLRMFGAFPPLLLYAFKACNRRM